MKNKQNLDLPLSIKSVNDSGEFSGYGSVNGNKDSYGDIIQQGAFTKSLKGWKEKGRLPSLLWQHKMDEPIGIYTRIEEDEKGLFVEGRLLTEDDPLARRAHAHMKAGSLSGLSIGYITNDADYDEDQDALLLKEVDLWEVSLVTFPANDEARIQSVKNLLDLGRLPRQKTVEAVLRDAGFSRQQAKAILAKGYKGIDQREADNSLESIRNLNNLIKGT
jgi:HK97 family phage prohead protease